MKRIILAVATVLGCWSASAQDEPAGPILITNVNVFDGINETLINDANVVVTGNLISIVSTEPLAVAGGRVIDGVLEAYRWCLAHNEAYRKKAS